MAGFVWQGSEPLQVGIQNHGYDAHQFGAQGYHQDSYFDKGVEVYAADAAQLGFSAASTAPPDLYGSWGGSVSAGNLGGSFSTQPYRSADLDSFDGITNFAMDSSNLTDYPRIITAAKLLEESDDDSTWCGPPSEPGESAESERRSMEAWGIGNPEDEKETEKRPKRNNRREGGGDRDRAGGGSAVLAAAAAAAAASTAPSGRDSEAPQDRSQRESRDRREKDPARERPKRDQREPGDSSSRRPPSLILPRGEVDGDNQKFICVFQIGLEDDEEFCLVKRILGKAGNNMRRIAEECSAKVRLRGIGSGFLEGADGREANMPLQLNVSCVDFESYQGAVDRVSTLLKDLYKHYRRYARSKGQEPPEVKVTLEEVRRDDVGLDVLQQKAQRSPSQRERDRRAREKERQLQRDKEREKERERAEREPNPTPRPRQRSRERYTPERDCQGQDDSDDNQSQCPTTLPDGAPIPTTPAGRRMAARSGGAEAAAIASAAARENEKADRERSRRDRDDTREKDKDDREAKKKEAAARAAAMASRSGRGGARAAAKPSSALVNSPAKEEPTQISSSTAKTTSSPAKDVPGDTWNSWKGTQADEWDPWAAAANKGKGKSSSEEASGKGKEKGAGKRK